MVRELRGIPLKATALAAGWLAFASAAWGQAATQKPGEHSIEKQGEKAVEAPNAAQIESLETNYRFEANGDSRKEVHALVKMNSELGVRQLHG